MHRHTLTNLILVVVLFALGVLAWMRPGIEAPREPFTLTEYNFDALQSIRAEKNGQLVYQLEKIDGNWRLIAPDAAAADPAEVEQLINKTKLTSKNRYSVSEVNLAELGFAEPFMKLVIDDQELLVGNNESISQRRYVKSGDWVYLVDSLAIFSLDRDPDMFLPEPTADNEPDNN